MQEVTIDEVPFMTMDPELDLDEMITFLDTDANTMGRMQEIDPPPQRPPPDPNPQSLPNVPFGLGIDDFDVAASAVRFDNDE